MSTNSLIDFFLKVGDLKRIKRRGWIIRKVKDPESVADHSFRTTIMALVIGSSREDLDFGKLLRLALLHDLGEIKTDDILYHDKKTSDRDEEYDFYKTLLTNFPNDLKEYFHFIYSLQNINKDTSKKSDKLKEQFGLEAKLFETIERYGYIVFAYGDYSRTGKEKLIVQVLRNQHPPLKKLAEELPGFKHAFYNPKTQKSIEEFLEVHKKDYLILP